MSEVNINEIAARSLGSANSYAVYTDESDASLLNFMPREAARKDWGITGDDMDGFDIWHSYESTFLLDSGQPVAGVMKLVFPLSNTRVVESKSLKLYLNTYDMTKMGKTFKEAISNYERRVEADLLAGGLVVRARFFSAHVLESSMRVVDAHPLAKFSLLNVGVDVEFDDYTAQRTYIPEAQASAPGRHLVYTNVLRSRCRHTKQKDSGTAFFHVEGQYKPVEILKTVVALREVNEFHEFCAEKLFTELSRGYSNVGVFLLYSRRGGIDIHPVRFAKTAGRDSFVRRLANDLADPRFFHHPIFGQ